MSQDTGTVEGVRCCRCGGPLSLLDGKCADGHVLVGGFETGNQDVDAWKSECEQLKAAVKNCLHLDNHNAIVRQKNDEIAALEKEKAFNLKCLKDASDRNAKDIAAIQRMKEKMAALERELSGVRDEWGCWVERAKKLEEELAEQKALFESQYQSFQKWKKDYFKELAEQNSLTQQAEWRLNSFKKDVELMGAVLAEQKAEVLEQCRLNGMGAQREAALLGEVERLKKDRGDHSVDVTEKVKP